MIKVVGEFNRFMPTGCSECVFRMDGFGAFYVCSFTFEEIKIHGSYLKRGEKCPLIEVK